MLGTQYSGTSNQPSLTGGFVIAGEVVRGCAVRHRTVMTLLQPRQMIPTFILSGTDGREIRSSSYRGRKSLVLIFPNAEMRPMLARLVSRVREVREEEAELLVFASDHREVEAGVTLVVDESGEVIRRFVADGNWAVYITDPYGEIYAAFPNERYRGVPDADEILASLRHINAACPE